MYQQESSFSDAFSNGSNVWLSDLGRFRWALIGPLQLCSFVNFIVLASQINEVWIKNLIWK